MTKGRVWANKRPSKPWRPQTKTNSHLLTGFSQRTSKEVHQKKKGKRKQKMGDMAGNLETVPYGSLERTAAFTRMH